MVKGNLLHNKYVLYVLLFLAVTNVLGYLAIRDFDALSLFIVVGIIAHYFSKNMTVILGTSIVVTALFKGSRHFHPGTREGLAMQARTAEEDKEEEGFTEAGSGEEEEEEPEEPARGDKATGIDLGKRIDYAGTMEQSYNNLQDILGGGGMDKLTHETKTLIDQQSNLMKQLEGLGPIMKNAKETMEMLDGSGMQDMMKKFMPAAQAFLQKK